MTKNNIRAKRNVYVKQRSLQNILEILITAHLKFQISPFRPTIFSAQISIFDGNCEILLQLVVTLLQLAVAVAVISPLPCTGKKDPLIGLSALTVKAAPLIGLVIVTVGGIISYRNV